MIDVGVPLLSLNSTSIVAKHVHVVRGGLVLLHNIAFELKPASILYIKGPNGVGKTSLLLQLAGLISAMHLDNEEERMLLWGEAPVCDWPKILLLTHNGCDDALTTLQNLHFLCAQTASRVDGALSFSTEQVIHALQCVGLSHELHTAFRHLSSGQKKRVELAVLWVFNAPVLWILDEPFNALDQEMSQLLIQRMQAHTHQGGRIVYTSHYDIALYDEVLNASEYIAPVTGACV